MVGKSLLVSLGLHQLFVMRKTPPLLDVLDSSALSTRRTEKDFDVAWGLSHVPVRQKMPQSTMSWWNPVFALRLSILLSKGWTPTSSGLDRGGWWAWALSMFPTPSLSLLIFFSFAFGEMCHHCCHCEHLNDLGWSHPIKTHKHIKTGVDSNPC